jgi:hypothetical protein
MSNFWKTSNGEVATGVNETATFPTIPRGDRKIIINKVEIKDSEKYGRKISFQHTITEGEFKKRVLFSNINLYLPPNFAKLKEDDKQKAINKQDKAINLMVGLFNALGVALPQCNPEDIKAIDLARLCNKPVIIDMYPYQAKKDNPNDENEAPKQVAYIANNFKKATPAGAVKPQTKNEAEDAGNVLDDEKQPASTVQDLDEDDGIPF